MSIALYRKYRPATFGEVRGQEHVTDPLRQALRSGRINHAYLFSGPRGCGKTTSARILARSLNCEQGPTPDPCGTCDSCVALAPDGGGSIDVIEIDAASHGGVDDARDLRERAFFSPVNSRYKIYIIDEAHMVTREGFNALLKLVEEPPPHLKFVFATTEPEKVIGTIRSRTHHYPFRLIPPSTLKELMEDLLKQEDVSYDPAALPLVVRAGAGSARDTLSVLDQLIAGSDEGGITREGAVSLLGYTDSSLLGEMVDALGARDGAAAFSLVDRIVEGGHDPRRFTTDLLERFRDLVVLAAVPDALDKGLVNVSPESAEQMREQAARLGPAELSRGAEILNQGLTEMRGATAPRLLLELMCSRILLPATDGAQGAALLARLEQMERRVASGAIAPAASAPAPAAAPVAPAPAAPAPAAPAPQAPAPAAPAPQAPARPSAPEPPPRPAPPAAAGEPAGWDAPPRNVPEPAQGAAVSAPPGGGGPLDLGRVQGAWHQILEAVKGRRRFTWMVLTGSDVQPVGVEGNTVLLGFSKPNEAKGFSNSGSDKVVAGAIQQVLGAEVRVAPASGGNQAPPRRAEPAPRPAPQQQAPRPAEPAGWDAPAPAPQAEQPGPGAPEAAPAPQAAPAQPAGPPPDRIVTGLQEPPPDPYEDGAAAPPPDDGGFGRPVQRGPAPKAAEPSAPVPSAPVPSAPVPSAPAPSAPAPSVPVSSAPAPNSQPQGGSGSNTSGGSGGGSGTRPAGGGAALIETELGGKLLEEIEHGAAPEA
ncbi:DNA polymerase III subunit gamma and tau [Nocardiopsis exhalans]|uniref:DNA polymerase III subunit gamma/tau n=1 Tax=Nocardiopsis exhalans TaxID=163604 RepID=A0ABY5DAY7_9ACTN|nr:DNA polymerase III subunit gamma and tau [Nocardiopsis exhalans]USY20292.1 DNA polymerase III subunit gamma and tau [Nocardiopsis exhalans]